MMRSLGRLCPFKESGQGEGGSPEKGPWPGDWEVDSGWERSDRGRGRGMSWGMSKETCGLSPGEEDKEKRYGRESRTSTWHDMGAIVSFPEEE